MRVILHVTYSRHKCRYERWGHKENEEQRRPKHLELQRGTLRLLLTTKLEVLASLERELHLVLAHCTFQSEYDLLRRLGLFVEDGLGLTTVTGLLAVVTTLSLSRQ